MVLMTRILAKSAASKPLLSAQMVQFCCGSGDCIAAGVPWGKRQDSTELVGAGNGLQGAFLKFANGTIIPPLENGPSPDIVTRQDECDGFKEGSYVADGDLYLKTFGTVTVTPSVGPFTQDTEIDVTYDQSISRSTSFDVSLGDPFGIISLSVGVEFQDSESEGFTIKVPVPARQQGVVGFTPVYQCTSGTLESCDGVRTDPGETCTPFLTAKRVCGGRLPAHPEPVSG
ncbi:hypothetical protein F5883DRAFT_607120 [Diaporthe sp. PMI_573]|nr:hypothetical protein F5883DRAFT_607120 [Diaporthaceae sp. PMI_573]